MRLALFGGSFNPPTTAHFGIVEELLRRFDRVVVIPCGIRPDKPSTEEVSLADRCELARIAFAGVSPRLALDLTDLEQGIFTRTHGLEARYGDEDDAWHVVGTDIIVPDQQGRVQIKDVWEQGRIMWNALSYAIITRGGHDLDGVELPPHHELVPLNLVGSSTDVKAGIKQGKPWKHLVTPAVADYIERRGLYR